MKRLILFLALATSAVAASPAPTEKQALIARHDTAVYIMDVWMRDPYITLGPDGLYYLTGTTANRNDPRWPEDRYNAGLDNPVNKPDAPPSIVGQGVRIWQSADLVNWTELPTTFTLDKGYWAEANPEAFATIPRKDWRLWAPEVFFHHGKWIIVHTTPAPVKGGANLAIANGPGFAGPFSHPMGANMEKRHDPSLFLDPVDDQLYLLWGNTLIAPIKADYSGFAAEPVRIDPSDRRIGHEGATLRKIGDKYVHLGTAWSTDQMRKGSYNLYYCESDHPMGPYGPRKFAGRFLGHGTPFQDKQGRWWCTAFFNGNIPPVSDVDIQNRDLGDNAQTINAQGVTIVPLDVRVLDNGEIYIRAIDPRYATPGPDEAQSFDLSIPGSRS